MIYDKGSVIAVLDAVTQCGEISRAELSHITGYSRVTVGKAVELLDSIGMVVQYKGERGSAGRKAEICSMNTGCGMLLLEIGEGNVSVRICDCALRIVREYETSASDLAEVFINGLGSFAESFGDGLLGVGCVIDKRYSARHRGAIKELLGHEPEVLLESETAYAIADSKRFDYSGTAFFLRVLANGEISLTIMHRHIPYLGAHSQAGRIGMIVKNVEELPSKLAEAVILFDPELIHIACESEDDMVGLSEKIAAAVGEISGDSCLPDITVEPLSLCRTPLDGAAIRLREYAVKLKMENNT